MTKRVLPPILMRPALAGILFWILVLGGIADLVPELFTINDKA